MVLCVCGNESKTRPAPFFRALELLRNRSAKSDWSKSFGVNLALPPGTMPIRDEISQRRGEISGVPQFFARQRERGRDGTTHDTIDNRRRVAAPHQPAVWVSCGRPRRTGAWRTSRMSRRPRVRPPTRPARDLAAGTSRQARWWWSEAWCSTCRRAPDPAPLCFAVPPRPAPCVRSPAAWAATSPRVSSARPLPARPPRSCSPSWATTSRAARCLRRGETWGTRSPRRACAFARAPLHPRWPPSWTPAARWPPASRTATPSRPSWTRRGSRRTPRASPRRASSCWTGTARPPRRRRRHRARAQRRLRLRVSTRRS